MTTLTSPHDLLAAIPFLIGFHPSDSLVLVSLKDDSVGMAMRVDYPIESRDLSHEFDSLVSHLTRESTEGALIVAYLPNGRSDGREILEGLSAALARASITLHESLLIWNNRWKSLLCHDELCCPETGRELPEIESSRIAVEQVTQGQPMPFADIDELKDSILPLPLSTDEEFLQSVNTYFIDQSAENLQSIQRQGAIGVIDLASRFIAGSIGKDFAEDQEFSARVIGRMKDIQIRDFSLGSHSDTTMEIYWAMWRYLTRIAPKGFVAPVASLLAALSYERGDGALAHRALDRALEDDPAYSLALLLRRVFSAGWPPQSFAQMRKDLHPKVCAGIFEGPLDF
jgi:hypothetical protein